MIPAPGPHGGDGGRVAAALGLDPAAVLDLSLSLNPVAPDARELVGKHLDAVLRYPDPAPATLFQKAYWPSSVRRVAPSPRATGSPSSSRV